MEFDHNLIVSGIYYHWSKLQIFGYLRYLKYVSTYCSFGLTTISIYGFLNQIHKKLFSMHIGVIYLRHNCFSISICHFDQKFDFKTKRSHLGPSVWLVKPTLLKSLILFETSSILLRQHISILLSIYRPSQYNWNLILSILVHYIIYQWIPCSRISADR